MNDESRSSFRTHHSSLIIHHSSFIIPRSSFIIPRSSFLVHHYLSGADQAEDEAKEDEADGVSYSEFALSSAKSVPPENDA